MKKLSKIEKEIRSRKIEKGMHIFLICLLTFLTLIFILMTIFMIAWPIISSKTGGEVVWSPTKITYQAFGAVLCTVCSFGVGYIVFGLGKMMKRDAEFYKKHPIGEKKMINGDNNEIQ